MIRYRLQCGKGHGFEGWFRSSDDYDGQRKKRLVNCPTCGTTKVEKAIMAPSVVTSEQAVAARKSKAKRNRADTPAVASDVAAAPVLTVNDEQRAMMRKLRDLRDAMLKSSDYVGPRFAEEARRMHEDESVPERAIHGEATPDEVKSLEMCIRDSNRRRAYARKRWSHWRRWWRPA